MKNVSAALVKAQKQFGPALKSSTNPHFKSRYADLAACVEAVMDALNANGIALVQRTLECTDGVTIETVFYHESGESLSSGPLHVPASKQDAQGYGSALTYARRYSLMAACGIAPEDDDGNAASKPRNANTTAGRTGVVQDVLSQLPELDEETKTYLQDLAVKIHKALAKVGADETVRRLNQEELESDQYIYLWSLLDSKTRTALDAAGGKNPDSPLAAQLRASLDVAKERPPIGGKGAQGDVYRVEDHA